MGQTHPPNINICSICKYYKGTKLFNIGKDIEQDQINYCKAYSNGIPEEILSGKDKHLKIRTDQDNDIVFEKIKEK